MGHSGVTRDGDSRQDRAFPRGGCGAAFFLVFGLLFVALSAGGGSGCTAKKNSDPDQAAFQAKVMDDRKQLFGGRLLYRARVSADVGDSVTYTISLTALGEDASRKLAQVRPSTKSRPFQVGGVEGATLSSTSRSVKVELLADTKTKQIIVAPGDTASWQWSISPSKPGDYALVLTLATYQGESDRALDTLSPPLTIHLSVHNTWSHWINSIQTWLITLGSVAAALTVLFTFRAPLAEFMRNRWDSWRQRHRGRHDERDGYL